MKPSISLLLLPLTTSAQTVLETNPKDCVVDYEEGVDYFPEKFIPHETTDLFDIEYYNTYKVINNKFNEKSYLLYQCGTEPPADEINSGKYHIILPVPHKGGVAITETPQIAPLELLATRTDINAYIGNPQLVSSPCLNHLLNEETVETIFNADDPYNSTLNRQNALDYVANNPETIVFAGPTGNDEDERHMAFAASQERTAVATFDWLGMYAAIFNLEGMANKIVADTEARYDCSLKNAKALVADIQEESKPKILWANYFSGIGWSIAECPTPDKAYYCEFANHCGAEIISRPEGMGFSQQYGTPTIYWYVTDDEFLELAKDADTWIYPSKTFSDVYEEKKELLDQFKSVQNKNVYDTQGQGPNGWFEQRLAEYDVVALDMCSLVGTNNPDVIHRRRWFRNYFDEPIGSSGSCDVAGGEIEEAYEPAEANCILLNQIVENKEPDVEDEEPQPPEDQPATEDSTTTDLTVESVNAASSTYVVTSLIVAGVSTFMF